MKNKKTLSVALFAIALINSTSVYANEDYLHKKYDSKKAARDETVNDVQNTVDDLVKNEREKLKNLSEEAGRIARLTSRFSNDPFEDASHNDYNDDIVRIYSVDSAKKLKATQIANILHYTNTEKAIVTARAAAQIAGTFIPGFAAYKLSKNNSGSTVRNTAAAVVGSAFGFAATEKIVQEYMPITLAELVEEKEKRFVREIGSTNSQSIVRAFCQGRFMLRMDEEPTVSKLTAYKKSPNYEVNLNQVNDDFQRYTDQGIRLLISPREEFLERLVNYREVLDPLLERAKTHSMPKSKVHNIDTINNLIDRAEKDIDTYKTLFAMSLEEEKNRRQNLDS